MTAGMFAPGVVGIREGTSFSKVVKSGTYTPSGTTAVAVTISPTDHGNPKELMIMLDCGASPPDATIAVAIRFGSSQSNHNVFYEAALIPASTAQAMVILSTAVGTATGQAVISRTVSQLATIPAEENVHLWFKPDTSAGAGTVDYKVTAYY